MNITLAVTELRSKRKERQRLLKKEVHWFKKDGTEHNSRERKKNKDGGGKKKQRERERKRDRLVFLSRLCGMTSLCTAAVFVNQGQGCLLDNFSGRKEGRRGKRGRGGGGWGSKKEKKEG